MVLNSPLYTGNFADKPHYRCLTELRKRSCSFSSIRCSLRTVRLVPDQVRLSSSTYIPRKLVCKLRVCNLSVGKIQSGEIAETLECRFVAKCCVPRLELQESLLE